MGDDRNAHEASSQSHRWGIGRDRRVPAVGKLDGATTGCGSRLVRIFGELRGSVHPLDRGPIQMSVFRAVGLLLGLCGVMALGCFLAIFRYGDPNLNHYVMNLYSTFGSLIGIRTKVENIEGMTEHQPCIYMGNHQSGLDVAVYGAVFPDRTVAIGKIEILYVPFLGLFWKAGRNLLINRSNRRKSIASLQKAADLCINERLSVGMFPEGTRNRKLEGLLPFKKGGFYLAVQTQFPIVPIVAESYKEIGALEGGRVKAGEIRVKVLEPIETKGKTVRDIPELLEKVRSAMLKAQAEF